jgi:hypothetical protein
VLSLRKRKRDINHLQHGRIYSTLFIRRSPEEQAWLDMVPFGAEFGSKDFEKLMHIDSQGAAAKGQLDQWARIAKAAQDNPWSPQTMIRSTL